MHCTKFIRCSGVRGAPISLSVASSSSINEWQRTWIISILCFSVGRVRDGRVASSSPSNNLEQKLCQWHYGANFNTYLTPLGLSSIFLRIVGSCEGWANSLWCIAMSFRVIVLFSMKALYCEALSSFQTWTKHLRNASREWRYSFNGLSSCSMQVRTPSSKKLSPWFLSDYDGEIFIEMGKDTIVAQSNNSVLSEYPSR